MIAAPNASTSSMELPSDSTQQSPVNPTSRGKTITRSNPRVSIGLPCYNEAAFIERTLKSVLAQTDRDFELIISDNASTDGTAEIIAKVVADDPRVVLKPCSTNIGAPSNFIRTWEFASAPYFMWMGAHDVLAPDYVKKLRLVLDADPSCILAHADSIFIPYNDNDTSNETLECGPDCSSQDVVERVKSLLWTMTRCDIFQGLIRREKINPELIRCGRSPDLVVLADLVMKGRFIRVPQLLFYRRRNRPIETAEVQLKRLASQGYISEGESASPVEAMTVVRDAHLELLPKANLTDTERSTIRLQIYQAFKDRHSVPWDAAEAATWWERIRLAFASKDARQDLKEIIEQRIARTIRITDADCRRRLERELVSLLKENHRLRRALKKTAR